MRINGPIMKAARRAFPLALGLVIGTAAQCQTFPVKPIRIVVASAAGGGADVTGRLLAQKLTEALGQQVIIDNRPGAGNIIGTEAVAKAAPDGYTLLLAINNHAINASLYQKLPYDPVKDFAAVSLITKSPHVLVVHPSLPVRSVQDLIKLAKSRPGQINYSSGGNGTAAHFAAELFKLNARIDITHIPYKSLSAAVIDVLAGAVQMMFPSTVTGSVHVRSGRLRALAVTTMTRARTMPEVPTMNESGAPGYEFSSWFGLLAPAATPSAIITQLSRATAQAVQSKEVQTRLTEDGSNPVGGTPADFEAFLKSEVANYARLVKQIGLKID